MKYFYKDPKTGKNKRYRGKVNEVNGKLFGTVIETKTIEKRVPLTKEFNNNTAAVSEVYKAWKDKSGIEHRLTNEVVKDNEVIETTTVNFTCDYQDLSEIKTTYLYNGKPFEGKIVEENGKYFGIL